MFQAVLQAGVWKDGAVWGHPRRSRFEWHPWTGRPHWQLIEKVEEDVAHLEVYACTADELVLNYSLLIVHLDVHLDVHRLPTWTCMDFFRPSESPVSDDVASGIHNDDDPAAGAWVGDGDACASMAAAFLASTPSISPQLSPLAWGASAMAS